MRKCLGLLFVLAFATVPAGAEPAGELGAGFILGKPMGLTAKYYLSDLFAVDGGGGYGHGDGAVFYADLLIHSWTLLRQPASGGRTNFYVGGGPRVYTDDGGQFGIRAIAGVGYWPAGQPLELFAEIGPTFQLTSDNDVGVDGGIGLRYYFNVSLSPAR